MGGTTPSSRRGWKMLHAVGGRPASEERRPAGFLIYFISVSRHGLGLQNDWGHVGNGQGPYAATCRWGSGCPAYGPCIPPASCLGPARGTSSSWLWRAGLVPSLGQARPVSPGGRGTRLQPVAVYYAIPLYSGVFNHSGQKAPPTLWSLRGCVTGTVSPGSTRPSAQLHWPAVRPAPLGRGRGTPSAPRG